MDNNRYDLQLLNNDLVISKLGDFMETTSDEQHIQDTINAFPGWWKQYPMDGVGIRAYLGASVNTQLLTKNVRLQLQSDGYTVNNPIVNITNGTLTINPDATR